MLAIPLNKFQQIPHSSQCSSEVSALMRKAVRILHLAVHPPSVPPFYSPILPLIVMVIDSIV